MSFWFWYVQTPTKRDIARVEFDMTEQWEERFTRLLQKHEALMNGPEDILEGWAEWDEAANTLVRGMLESDCASVIDISKDRIVLEDAVTQEPMGYLERQTPRLVK